MDNNCHIPDLVQAFPNVENDGLNQVNKKRYCDLKLSRQGIHICIYLLKVIQVQNYNTNNVVHSKYIIKIMIRCLKIVVYS